MDGTYRVKPKQAVTHAARLAAGGIATFCGRGYPLDERFSRGGDPRRVSCKLCRAELAQHPPPRPGAWSGPTVYCTRGDLLTMGLLKQINTLLDPLSLFAELQADGTLRILDYRHLPESAAAVAEVVRKTKRRPPV